VTSHSGSLNAVLRDHDATVPRCGKSTRVALAWSVRDVPCVRGEGHSGGCSYRLYPVEPEVVRSLVAYIHQLEAGQV